MANGATWGVISKKLVSGWIDDYGASSESALYYSFNTIPIKPDSGANTTKKNCKLNFKDRTSNTDKTLLFISIRLNIIYFIKEV